MFDYFKALDEHGIVNLTGFWHCEDCELKLFRDRSMLCSICPRNLFHDFVEILEVDRLHLCFKTTKCGISVSFSSNPNPFTSPSANILNNNTRNSRGNHRKLCAKSDAG